MSSYLAILPGLSALLCVGLGVFVLTRNPRHPANIGFALGMASLSIMEAGDAISFLSWGGGWVLFWKRVSLVGEILLPPSWLLFSLTFARADYSPILTRWKPVLVGTSVLSLFFISWLVSPQMISLPAGNFDTPFSLGLIGRLFYIFLILGMVLNLIHLENTLRFATGNDRWQIKYTLIGVGSILAFQIYLASQALLYSQIDQGLVLATSAILLIAGGMLLFFIIRHRLLGANVFISRYVVYNSLTVLLVGGYLLLVGLAAQGIRWYGSQEASVWIPVFSFLAILAGVLVLLSNHIRRKVQLFINRNFYKHKHEFRDKWMETTKRLGSETSMEAIQKTLVTLIRETLGPREVALYLYDPEYKEFRQAESTFSGGATGFPDTHPFIQRVRETTVSFFLEEKEAQEGIPPEIVLCTPLIAGHEVVGFVLQGKDVTGVSYGSDDFEILKAITTQAANQIVNIRLSKALLAAKEAEAFHHVSSFFIHDLKNFVSTLSLLVQNAGEHMGDPSFQQDAIRTLSTTVFKMNAMISRLTLLSKGLELHPQPANLNNLLGQTLGSLNGQVSARLEQQLGILPTISVDEEQVQKVVLNLLLNAIEASPPAGKITLKTYAENDHVVFSVTDQGCGMSEEFIHSSLFRPFRSTKPSGLGIGLFQSRKIVEAHGGKIEVESEEGRGSEFRVVFPSLSEKI